MPDLSGVVDRWGTRDDSVFIEFRLRGSSVAARSSGARSIASRSPAIGPSSGSVTSIPARFCGRRCAAPPAGRASSDRASGAPGSEPGQPPRRSDAAQASRRTAEAPLGSHGNTLDTFSPRPRMPAVWLVAVASTLAPGCGGDPREDAADEICTRACECGGDSECPHHVHRRVRRRGHPGLQRSRGLRGALPAGLRGGRRRHVRP